MKKFVILVISLLLSFNVYARNIGAISAEKSSENTIDRLRQVKQERDKKLAKIREEKKALGVEQVIPSVEVIEKEIKEETQQETQQERSLDRETLEPESDEILDVVEDGIVADEVEVSDTPEENEEKGYRGEVFSKKPQEEINSRRIDEVSKERKKLSPSDDRKIEKQTEKQIPQRISEENLDSSLLSKKEKRLFKRREEIAKERAEETSPYKKKAIENTERREKRNQEILEEKEKKASVWQKEALKKSIEKKEEELKKAKEKPVSRFTELARERAEERAKERAEKNERLKRNQKKK